MNILHPLFEYHTNIIMRLSDQGLLFLAESAANTHFWLILVHYMGLSNQEESINRCISKKCRDDECREMKSFIIPVIYFRKSTFHLLWIHYTLSEQIQAFCFNRDCILGLMKSGSYWNIT